MFSPHPGSNPPGRCRRNPVSLTSRSLVSAEVPSVSATSLFLSFSLSFSLSNTHPSFPVGSSLSCNKDSQRILLYLLQSFYWSVCNRRVSKISGQLHSRRAPYCHLTFRCGVRSRPKGEWALKSGKQSNLGIPKAGEETQAADTRANLDRLEKDHPEESPFNWRCSRQLERISSWRG